MGKKPSIIKYIQTGLLRALRLTSKPTVRLYNGYGNNESCIIFGHVLSLSPIPRKRYRKNFLSNTLALIRLFIVRPVKDASVQLIWDGEIHYTKTAKDGFFKFEWKPTVPLKPGWHPVEVTWETRKRKRIVTGRSSINIPNPSQYAFISDIDDTFLISHSSNLRKRLFVLLTENARSRDPFEGVVNHYNLLSQAWVSNGNLNPFFFVSSSEWNLYDYIREFSSVNNLPKGVYLLSQIKRMKELLKTGQNNHSTKFMRIARIMEAYPQQTFVLLGDDTQEDPAIYASIVSHFPKKIYGVYIRKVHKSPLPFVQEKINEMQEAGVLCCYFKHSSEAVIHSKQVGLINEITPPV